MRQVYRSPIGSGMMLCFDRVGDDVFRSGCEFCSDWVMDDVVRFWMTKLGIMWILYVHL